MAHVAQWKRKEVEDLARIAASAPVVGVAKIDAIPSNNMHAIRRSLRGHATMRVAKNRLIARALTEAARQGRPDLEKLADHCDGQSVLIASDMSPFKLYKALAKAKSKAPAKAGQIAPADIVVHAGETPFKPGPVVGELQKAGIPAKIDQGKVIIASDKVMVRAGEAVPAELAQMLPRLEILPMTVGLVLRAAWEDGMLYKQADMAIDEDKVMADIRLAAARGRALVMAAAYPAPQLIEELVAKAHREALAVALDAAFPDAATIEKLIGRAFAAAAALGRLAPEALSEEDRAALAAAASAAPAPAASGAPAKEEKKEENVSEEEAAAGLGSLFG